MGVWKKFGIKNNFSSTPPSNLNYDWSLIFHNLSGYDSHLFVKNFGVKEGNVDCIPKNEEIYISFSKEVVVDSYLEKAEGKENANENVKCFLLNVNAKCFLFLLFQLTEAKLFVSGAD